MLTPELAPRVEHMIVRPELLPPEVHRGVTAAMRLGLGSVVLAPVWVQRVATMLKGSGVRVCATIGFPHGTNKSTLKAIEATSCIKDGADAIRVVPHLANVLRQDLDAMKFELLEIARAARTTRPQVVIEVVVESAWVMELDPAGAEQVIATALRAVRESACDAVVSGSGFAQTDLPDADHAKVLELMRRHAEGLSVIASDVDGPDLARALLEAGADRVSSDAAVDWFES